MPIQGLTGRGPRFPEIGKLFKGSKKEKRTKDGREYEVMGKELDHWRFESKELHIMEAFYNAFGPEPKEIPVYLPLMRTDENFEAWQEAYTAGGLAHRCDGKTCVVWLDEKSGTYQNTPVPCPTLSMAPEKAKREGCKPVARMRVVIPALNQIGYVTVETHSKNDILHLDAALPAYESLRADGLRGIPMMLCRVEKQISTPGENGGKRARRSKWMIEIKPHPQWASLYLDNQRQAALAAVAEDRLLTTSLTEEEEEEIEAEQLLTISIETLDAIEKLWPKHGTLSNGKLVTFAEYLKEVKGLDDPTKLTAAEGEAMLIWLQKKALAPAKSEKKETVSV